METKPTIRESIKLFANYLYASNLAKSTSSAYMNDLKDFEEYVKMKHPSIRYIEQIRLVEIVEYQTYLTSYVDAGEFSPFTKDRRVFSLRSFFKYLYKSRFIENDVFSGEKYKKTKITAAPKYLEQEEIDALFQSIQSNNDRNHFRDLAIFSCLRYLGARRAEVLNLKWSSINFYENTIEIYYQKTQNYSVVLMHPKLKEALLNLYKVIADKTLDYVFISNKGNKLSNTAFNNIIRKYTEAAGLEGSFDITSKTFRHSFCTHLAKNNVSPELIIKYTGHSSTDSLKYYTRFKTDDLNGLVSSL
jgi:site-specific recombinase XerD